jgi:hypothetical protein
MPRHLGITISVLAGLALGAAAHAQNPQPAPAGPTPPQVTPLGPTTTPPERVAPQDNGSTLSNRLSRAEGTLTPSPIDPGIAKPPPIAGKGTMPVIPPPGTAGGDQAVVPK